MVAKEIKVGCWLRWLLLDSMTDYGTLVRMSYCVFACTVLHGLNCWLRNDGSGCRFWEGNIDSWLLYHKCRRHVCWSLYQHWCLLHHRHWLNDSCASSMHLMFFQPDSTFIPQLTNMIDLSWTNNDCRRCWFLSDNASFNDILCFWLLHNMWATCRRNSINSRDGIACIVH